MVSCLRYLIHFQFMVVLAMNLEVAYSENVPVLLRDSEPGPGHGVPTEIASLGEAAVVSVNFATVPGTGSVHGELWITDATPEGAMLLKDINPGSAVSSPRWLTSLGGCVYFNAVDGSAGGRPGLRMVQNWAHCSCVISA
jgi:ELWxxDGT repeat protein